MLTADPIGDLQIDITFASMNGINGLFQGIGGFLGAFGFILRHRMGWLFAVPALLWILLAFGLFTFLSGPADRLTQWAADRLAIEVQPSEGFWNDLIAVIDGARELLVMLVLKLAIAYLLFVVNKYIVLILLSPLLAYASERAEEILTGREFPFEWIQFLKDAVRGASIAARNGILEIGLSIAIWLLTLFIPLFAPFSVIVLFVISAYFYGFSMFDYIFERRRMRVGETVKAVNERIPIVLGNGAMFSILMKIPLIGMTLAPAMAAVGAVRSMRGDPLFDRIAGSDLLDRK